VESLYSVTDIMSRYQCSRQTAVRYIQKMEHMEKPYMVTEKALRAWEQAKTVCPPEVIRAAMIAERIRKKGVGKNAG